MRKIAVFEAPPITFRDYHPKSLFLLIRDIEDIRGRLFEGVIFRDGYFNSKELLSAEELLRARQPELFQNNKNLT